MRKRIPKQLSLSVVGVQYRVTMSTREMIAARIVESGPLTCKLEREPDNYKDPLAIKVVIVEQPYRGLHIGYIRRQVAQLISPRLDKREISVRDIYLVELWPRDGEGEMLLTLKMPIDKQFERALSELA
jgi:hypothetical protein